MQEICKSKDKERIRARVKQKEKQEVMTAKAKREKAKITNLGMVNRLGATQIRIASIVMAGGAGSQNAPRNETPCKLRHPQPLLQNKKQNVISMQQNGMNTGGAYIPASGSEE